MAAQYVLYRFAGDCEHGLGGDLGMDEDHNHSLHSALPPVAVSTQCSLAALPLCALQDPTHTHSDGASVRQCLTRCSACGRCRYVSLSLSARVCSWHATCDLANLSHIDERVRTGPWDVRLDRAFVSGPRLSLV